MNKGGRGGGGGGEEEQEQEGEQKEGEERGGGKKEINCFKRVSPLILEVFSTRMEYRLARALQRRLMHGVGKLLLRSFSLYLHSIM